MNSNAFNFKEQKPPEPLKAPSHGTIVIIIVAHNGLLWIQWKCSHCTTTSSSPFQHNGGKNKTQSRITQCEWALAIRLISVKNVVAFVKKYEKIRQS